MPTHLVCKNSSSTTQDFKGFAELLNFPLSRSVNHHLLKETLRRNLRRWKSIDRRIQSARYSFLHISTVHRALYLDRIIIQQFRTHSPWLRLREKTIVYSVWSLYVWNSPQRRVAPKPSLVFLMIACKGASKPPVLPIRSPSAQLYWWSAVLPFDDAKGLLTPSVREDDSQCCPRQSSPQTSRRFLLLWISSYCRPCYLPGFSGPRPRCAHWVYFESYPPSPQSQCGSSWSV